jgi:hypothetical protein
MFWVGNRFSALSRRVAPPQVSTFADNSVAALNPAVAYGNAGVEAGRKPIATLTFMRPSARPARF